MIGRILTAFTDPDVRGYVAWLATRPGRWVLRRPDLTSRTPEYLLGVAATPLRHTTIGPLIHWGSGKIGDLSYRLASTSVQAIQWTETFKDSEDDAAVHRFAWLLPWMIQQRQASADAVGAAVSSWQEQWIVQHPEPDCTEAWQSYTVSERIVNWIFAAMALGEALQPRVATALELAAEHLLRNLEYYGDRWSGNHLANNGRALYFAGVVLGKEKLAAAGRMILIRQEAKLFSLGGFLREDSTHYQLLVTRNYHEVLWLAHHTADAELVAVLAPRVAAMEQACRFFLVGEELPLIGDTSPDSSPQWRGLVFRTPPPATEGGVSDDGAWARLEHAGWIVIAHANRRGAVFQPGHGHSDTGGFVAHWNGLPSVTEAGRRTYAKTRPGRFGLGGASHSLLMIDERNPEPRSHWLIEPAYGLGALGREPRLECEPHRLTIRHSGYSRIRGVGEVTRIIRPNRDAELEVEDIVEGHGHHRITLIYHLSHRTTVTLPPDLTNVREYRAPAESDTFGWGTPRYGDRAPLVSLVATGEVTLPWRGSSRVRTS